MYIHRVQESSSRWQGMVDRNDCVTVWRTCPHRQSGLGSTRVVVVVVVMMPATMMMEGFDTPTTACGGPGCAYI